MIENVDFGVLMDRMRALSQKANQALLDGKPLVLESEHEKIAIRSYAEREYSYLKDALGLRGRGRAS